MKYEIENGNLKQAINLNFLQLDDLQQYSRENIRIYGIPESQFKADDDEKVIMEIAKESKIELEETNFSLRDLHLKMAKALKMSLLLKI